MASIETSNTEDRITYGLLEIRTTIATTTIIYKKFSLPTSSSLSLSPSNDSATIATTVRAVEALARQMSSYDDKKIRTIAAITKWQK